MDILRDAHFDSFITRSMTRRIFEEQQPSSLDANSGRIAIITLIGPDQANASEGELLMEVRRELELSRLSEWWRVDNVAILDESAIEITNYRRTQLVGNRIP